jgi:O-antigen/teichoic acid export membrane protein
VSDGSTARGALVGIVTVVLERAVAFVVVLVLARTLSPEAFGRWGYVLAGMTLVQVLADQGVEVAAVARMSAAPAAARGILGATLAWRVLVWLLLAIPVGAIVLPTLSASENGGLGAAGLAASGLVLVGASISLRGVRRARGDMIGMARTALADALVGGTAVIVAARAGVGIAGLFATRVVASLAVTLTGMLGRDRPDFGGALRARMAAIGPVALPLAANALLIAIQTRGGHLAAMSLAGATAVGLLGAAARVTEVLGVLPEGVLLALFPRMAAEPDAAVRLAGDAARRLATVVLAPVVVLTIGATAIATGLFGTSYAGAGPAIAVLAWGALFTVTGGVTLHALIARGAERPLVAANVVAAALGLALQVVLIPRLGVVGAAIATVTTAAIGQATLLVPSRTRPVVVTVWRSAAPAVLLALCVIGVSAVGTPALPGALAAGAAYVLLATLAGVVGLDDWRQLLQTLARTPPG